MAIFNPLTVGIAAVVIFLSWLLFGRKKTDKPVAKPVAVQARATPAVEDKRPRILVLYGSQTGTAENFSRILGKEGNRWGFNTKVEDIADYDKSELASENLVIFVVATYGEGEPTDSAREFYEWIMEDSLDHDMLGRLKYTLFSLGNKQYKQYQAIGRLLDKRLVELGGQSVFERGEGDADATIEEDFDEWKSRMWPELSQLFGTTPEEEKIEKLCEIRWHDEITEELPPFPIATGHVVHDVKKPAYCKLIRNEEKLLKADDRCTRHIEFDISGTTLSYEAGDHLGVYPENEPAMVESVARRLGVEDQLDRVLSLVPMANNKDQKLKVTESGSMFPNKATLRTVLSSYIDLHGIPKKALFRVLALYAEDVAERERLEKLGSASERTEFQNYMREHGWNLLEVLNDFPSVKVPLDHLLEVMPRLNPRYYSIASSGIVHTQTVHLVVALMTYTTPRNVTQAGVCTSFLTRIDANAGKRVAIFVRRSNFKLPRNPARPVIMVGPGTGLAPFLGFVQQLQHSLRAGKQLGPSHLFFGCRKKSEDFIFEFDLNAAVEEKALTKLHVAFSRDQTDKEYVQHLILRNSEDIWAMLNDTGYFYVCGDARHMAKDVDNALIEVAMKHGGKTKEQAEAYIQKLQSTHRYLRDVWSPTTSPFWTKN